MSTSIGRTIDVQPYKNPRDLRDDVIAHDGLMRVSMMHVRDACGHGRLGVWVRQQIATKQLPEQGLSHLPAGELPGDQNESVWIYARDTPVGQLIGAVLDPSPQGAERLKAAATNQGSRADERLRDVREWAAALPELLGMDSE